jgi:hypothetical protein
MSNTSAVETQNPLADATTTTASNTTAATTRGPRKRVRRDANSSSSGSGSSSTTATTTVHSAARSSATAENDSDPMVVDAPFSAPDLSQDHGEDDLAYMTRLTMMDTVEADGIAAAHFVVMHGRAQAKIAAAEQVREHIMSVLKDSLVN